MRRGRRLGYTSAFSRRGSPEVCKNLGLLRKGGRREDQVRAAPAVSRAKMHMAKRTRAYRFSGGNPAFPARWFYGFLRALLGEPGFLATIAMRIAPHDLTPA